MIAETESDAYQLTDAEVFQTTIELRQGRLRIEGTARELKTQRVRDVFVVNGDSGSGLITLLDELAKRVDQRSGSFSTKKDTALEAYVQALSSSTPDARISSLRRAVELDPAFGLAYVALAQARTQNNPQDASQILAAANNRRAQFAPLDQARLDSFTKRALHAPLGKQTNATAALVNLTPNDAEALTLLGSEKFLMGDAAGGERMLRRALALNPDNVNARRQLAAGFVQARQFEAAEKLLAGLEANTALLPEIAVCELLKGDMTGADKIFARYLEILRKSNDPAAPLSQANWLTITQSPAKAAEYLRQSKFPSADLQSFALSQATICALMEGDNAAARASASAALHYAAAPVAKTFAAASMLSAGSNLPIDQFRAKVNASPLDPGTRSAVLAYGLFFAKQYAESAEVWKDIVKQSGDTDLHSRVMLCAALDRAGQQQAAQTIVVQPFIPNLTGGDLFAAVNFQEMRRLLKLGVR